MLQSTFSSLSHHAISRILVKEKVLVWRKIDARARTSLTFPNDVITLLSAKQERKVIHNFNELNSLPLTDDNVAAMRKTNICRIFNLVFHIFVDFFVVAILKHINDIALLLMHT